MSLDLNKLESKLDAALAKETPETLNNYLKSKHNMKYRIVKQGEYYYAEKLTGTSPDHLIWMQISVGCSNAKQAEQYCSNYHVNTKDVELFVIKEFTL